MDSLSHPVRVRGLKLNLRPLVMPRSQSHPVRVRGLKLIRYGEDAPTQLVAPRAGAWIETYNLSSNGNVHMCRTPCGCVD